VESGTDGSLMVEEYGTALELFPLPTDADTLLAVLRDVFEGHWSSIRFGVLVQGGAWEVAAPGPPRRISVYDGYATVDFGPWHFHLCIGEHVESGPELGAIRRCARAELYRQLEDGVPTSWGLRMFNGEGTQTCTVLLPNPFLSDQQDALAEPDWSRLAAWDDLRGKYLGLAPDPLDRSGTGFVHGS
jgi:hypothetical protein